MTDEQISATPRSDKNMDTVHKQLINHLMQLEGHHSLEILPIDLGNLKNPVPTSFYVKHYAKNILTGLAILFLPLVIVAEGGAWAVAGFSYVGYRARNKKVPEKVDVGPSTTTQSPHEAVDAEAEVLCFLNEAATTPTS
jgi:hypothetical protein